MISANEWPELGNVAVSTARLAFRFDIPVTWDTALHASVCAKMGHVQVTGRPVAREYQCLFYVPSNLPLKKFTVRPKNVSQWFLRLSEKKKKQRLFPHTAVTG